MTMIPPQTSEMSTVDALWILIQAQSKRVRKALKLRILQEEKSAAQQQMVSDSLTRAFDELHSGQSKHDARKLFKK